MKTCPVCKEVKEKSDFIIQISEAKSKETYICSDCLKSTRPSQMDSDKMMKKISQKLFGI